jgi:hypothetical protein
LPHEWAEKFRFLTVIQLFKSDLAAKIIMQQIALRFVLLHFLYKNVLERLDDRSLYPG